LQTALNRKLQDNVWNMETTKPNLQNVHRC